MLCDRPHRYRIRVQGTLDASWSDRLQGMTIGTTVRGGTPVTTLSGDLIDQAALYGVLTTLFELHLPILSAIQLGPAGGTSEASPPTGSKP